MGWHLRLSDKTVRKFADLPIYCQRQKCSPGNVVSGSKVYADIRGGSLERGRQMRGRWKWRFSLHSFTVFRTFYIHGHTTAFTWYECQWHWPYFKVIRLFHIRFLINGVWYGKGYCSYRKSYTSFRCPFWWPWSTFEGHFSLGCHFHVHFSNLWQAFMSRYSCFCTTAPSGGSSYGRSGRPPPHWPKFRAGLGGATQTRGQIFT